MLRLHFKFYFRRNFREKGVVITSIWRTIVKSDRIVREYSSILASMLWHYETLDYLYATHA